MAEKIRSVLIIEVAGRPPEYLSEAIKAHIDKIKLLSGINVINATFATPKKLDEEKDLYTTFAEVEVETISLSKLLDLIFEYMPSSVEILEPTEVIFSSQEATMLLNDLAGRLHKYDDLAKIAKFQIHELSKKLQQFQQPATNKEVIQPLKVTLDNQRIEKKVSKKAKRKKK